MTKEWLEDRFNNNNHKKEDNDDHDDDDDDHDSLFSVNSNDTLHNYINFQSHRNDTGLEEAISFQFPFNEIILHEQQQEEESNEQLENSNIDNKPIRISTLLEEDDLVPIFDGAGWAGTRVWAAAIYAIQYLVKEYNPFHNKNVGQNKSSRRVMSLCELGCGLGVPGMIWHQLGGDVVLSDQPRIMSQLVQNVQSNFQETFVSLNSTTTNTTSSTSTKPTIQVEPLDWSRKGYQTLLQNTNFQQKGFDILLNCDCIYEPLYGKSWKQLIQVIDECLKHNPNCIVVTSVERRSCDGIDLFLREMVDECEFVEKVEKVLEDKERKLEVYVTTGKRKEEMNE